MCLHVRSLERDYFQVCVACVAKSADLVGREMLHAWLCEQTVGVGSPLQKLQPELMDHFLLT